MSISGNKIGLRRMLAPPPRKFPRKRKLLIRVIEARICRGIQKVLVQRSRRRESIKLLRGASRKIKDTVGWTMFLLQKPQKTITGRHKKLDPPE